ncbi:hypothetical protein A2U01_0093846, partial [Trifolium medium]|nr:hypothetical protein [Trifolium medium]
RGSEKLADPRQLEDFLLTCFAVPRQASLSEKA